MIAPASPAHPRTDVDALVEFRFVADPAAVQDGASDGDGRASE